MEPHPPQPFSRRAAMVGLVAAGVLFVVGTVSLAAGWLEVATACAAVFAVGWLGMRSRIRRVERWKREEEERERSRVPRPPADLRARRESRRRRP